MQSAIFWSFSRRAAPAAMLLGLLGSSGAAGAATTLAGAEFFIDPTPWVEPHPAGTSPCDADPGEGKGTPLPPTDGAWNSVTEAVKLAGVDPSQLPPGVHDLCVRFNDSKGHWGPLRFIHFTSGRGLAACEYYIDTDPGPGLGKPLPAQDGAFDANQENLQAGNIPVAGLAQGVHTLGSRCRDEWGRWGQVKTATVNITPLPAPAVVNALPGSAQATLNWNAVSAAASYNIYQGTTPNGEAATPVKTGVTGTSATVTGLSNGTKYYFKMAAVNTAATSALSNEVSTTPTPLLPDFVVGNLSVYPASPAPDGSFSVRLTVSNPGKADADGGQLAVWANQPNVQGCNATPDKAVAVGVLAAGTSKTLTVGGIAAGAADAKLLRVFVDGTCTSPELVEDNNQATLKYRVGTAPAPDFVVTNVVLTPASPASQGSFSAKVTVKNQGALAGNPGYLDIWADQSAAQACGAEGDDYAIIGSLAAGASKTVTFKLPAGSAGVKTLHTFIDSWCGVAESNESNNQSNQAYTVK